MVNRKEPFFRHILVFSQQFGAGDVKDSDNTGDETTGEDLLTGMEGHTAWAVLRHKVIQLSTGYRRQWDVTLLLMRNSVMNYGTRNYVYDVYGPDATSPYSKHAPSHRMKRL